MTSRSDIRLFGLLAFSAAFMAPAAFAQEAASTDAGQAAAGQPAMSTGNTSGRKTWEDLDTDKDGNLDRTEAAAVPSLQAVFDQADANGDGSLSGDEYKTYLAMNGKGQGARSGEQPGT